MKQPIKKSPFIALAVVLLLNVTVVLKTVYSQEDRFLEVYPRHGVAALGDGRQFNAYLVDGSSRQSVTDESLWSSGDPAIATVDQNGMVFCQTAGITCITASTTTGGTDSIYNTAEMICTSNPLPTEATMSILPRGGELDAHGILNLRAFLISRDGWAFDETERATWTTTDESVVHIYHPGEIYGYHPGTTDITAEYFCDYNGITYRDTASISVNDNPPDPTRTCTCDEAIFTSWSWNGSMGWNDCGEATACHSITGDNIVTNGVEISSPGGECSMTPACPPFGYD